MRFTRLLPLLLVACASADATIPGAWLSTPAAARNLLNRGPVLRLTTDVRVEKTAAGERLVRGDKALTPELAAIESFAVSEERGEVAFSAKRSDNFDIGLVSTDGSPIHWVPEDPADEVAVQWAPRGNKISFIVRGRTGDLVRTVHVPTATALTVDFPYATVRNLVWDAAAERFSVSYDSVDASERVDSLRYGGEDRRPVTPPAVRLDVAVDALPGAWLLRPSAMRYGDKLPLVIWLTPRRNEWNDARGTLMQRARLAVVVTSKLDDSLRQAIKDLPWVDHDHIYLVDPTDNRQPTTDNATTTVVAADPSLPAGRYRKSGNVVRVPPAVVESFAAGFIADQWKGHPPPNGSLR